MDERIKDEFYVVMSADHDPNERDDDVTVYAFKDIYSSLDKAYEAVREHVREFVATTLDVPPDSEEAWKAMERAIAYDEVKMERERKGRKEDASAFGKPTSTYSIVMDDELMFTNFLIVKYDIRLVK